MRTDLKFTYREYRALPETGPRYQLVEGELLLSPSPNFRHQRLVAKVFNALFNHVEHQKLGHVLSGPIDVILNDENVFVPDIVFVSNARMKIEVEEGLRGAPDLCVEVLSPSNKALDRETKRVQYARAGVLEYWIIEPSAKTVEVFRLQENPGAPVRTLQSNERLTTPLLADFTLDLETIFAT